MAYSSQTTVNGGPFSLPFTSRGGGNGEWQKVGPNDFAFQTRENIYINGNAGGFFYVETAERLDKQTGRLCSGTTDCPWYRNEAPAHAVHLRCRREHHG
jgi:hypothetical protein